MSSSFVFGWGVWCAVALGGAVCVSDVASVVRTAVHAACLVCATAYWDAPHTLFSTSVFCVGALCTCAAVQLGWHSNEVASVALGSAVLQSAMWLPNRERVFRIGAPVAAATGVAFLCTARVGGGAPRWAQAAVLAAGLTGLEACRLYHRLAS